VQTSTPFWRHVLQSYRDKDWHECIRTLRSAVDADPFTLTPRQILAALYLETGNVRLASLQYERLMPLAVGSGDLFRAVAIQRHVDAIQAGHAVEGRYAAIQRWFRMVGASQGMVASEDQGLTPGALLLLPPEAFEELLQSVRIEMLGLEPGSRDVEGGTVWVVSCGSLLWSLASEDGRSQPEQTAKEGMSLRVDPQIFRQARLDFEPQLPCECLAFDPSLISELAAYLPGIAGAMGPDLVHETRAAKLSRPARHEDFDFMSSSPRGESDGPPQLMIQGHAGEANAALVELTEWLEGGEITLPEAGTAEALAAAATPTEEPVRESVLELPAQDVPEHKKPRRGRPVVEAKQSIEMEGGLVVPAMRDPFADPIGNLGEPIERRREVRVAVALHSRIALLGIRTLSSQPWIGEARDLSPSGIGIDFGRIESPGTLAALENSVIRIDLGLEDGVLRVAGRVRNVVVEEDGSARAGIEFAMLTTQDRATIAGILDKAASTPEPEAPPAP
jgi:hypothetical protein